jgi:hypothetical protein
VVVVADGDVCMCWVAVAQAVEPGSVSMVALWKNHLLLSTIRCAIRSCAYGQVRAACTTSLAFKMVTCPPRRTLLLEGRLEHMLGI